MPRYLLLKLKAAKSIDWTMYSKILSPVFCPVPRFNGIVYNERPTSYSIVTGEVNDGGDRLVALFSPYTSYEQCSVCATFPSCKVSHFHPKFQERCWGITNKEAKDPKPDAVEEKDQDEPIVSSVLSNSHGDDNQTSSQGDKVPTDSKPKQDQSEANPSGQEKALKKPDKVLPCPRCNSLDTKFCYYNNYNVYQPRYFCRNCQRYWTAGGTMRNVPVGAGRRKNKHSGHHQALTCGLSAPMRPLNGNGDVQNFGPEAPECESMASVLNLPEQKNNAEMGSLAGGNGDEPPCTSSTTPSNCVENDLPEKIVPEEQTGFHGCYNGLTPMHPLQYFPGPPWPYWGPGWNNGAAIAASQRTENGIPNPVPWIPQPMFAPPTYCAPAIPFPVMPAPYWPCMSGWPNGAWSGPWSGPNSGGADSGNDSPVLGKHSRDGSLQEEEKSEKCLWIPKTLKIHDPDEAAKSSIWSTLGIKPDISLKRNGVFKAFQSGDESKGHNSAPVRNLHANPAALSRSRTFQEST